MRKIILNLAVTLDGLIEGPNGEYDWCFTDQDYGLINFYESVDSIFYGRKSWELFGNFSPRNNSSDLEKNIFERIKSKKQYIFSRSLQSVKGAVLISKNLKEEVIKIKNQPGNNIHLFGGAGLITSFINEDLVDEFMLAIHPVILGKGKPLFADIKERKNLKLIDKKVYSTGLVMLTYEKD